MDRIKALLEFLNDDPNDSFTRFALAREYLKRGDIEEALMYFEGLIERDPNYVGTYYHLGKLYEATGHQDRAVSTYKLGIDVARRSGDVHAESELHSALAEAEGMGFDE